jgi:hypothetical protein
MKPLTGISCLLFFSLPALCQDIGRSDSMQLHVDGKIFITVAKAEINAIAISIPLQSGPHKIRWIKKESFIMSLFPVGFSSPLTEIAMPGFFIRRNIFLKNYSEL